MKYKWIDIMEENIFTYGRIVGGGPEQNSRLAFHTADFVNWADGANVEAVFVGHTHGTVGYIDINALNMDSPPVECVINTNPGDVLFAYTTAFIETEKST
ncbi:MAG: hypothetical protein Q7J68_06020 [Thermoplasmata archaeon]|nr:hypothetical protein [Thermoplasmata archaeon]